MLKLPMYINEEDGSQVWCRKICPGASPDDDASCNCDMCRYWERNEYTELAARYVHSTYFIPDPMYNTRKSKVRSSSGEEVDRSEIDIVYHTMKTNGPLTSTKTIYSEGMTGDPFNVCKGDTSVKCSSNQRCTNKNLEGGCTPHPSEASVHAMDLNKDNRISYEEFVESVNVNMKESFDIIDSDKDQFITVEELNAFISTMWNIIIDPEKKYALDQEISVTKEIFLTMDWDGSNSLDIAEYVFLLGNTDVYGESTQSKTFSAEELILLCRQSTDIMWNEPIGRPLFRNLCGIVEFENINEIPKPQKLNRDWINDKNLSTQPFGWSFGDVWPTGVDKYDITLGLPIQSPSFIPFNLTASQTQS
jgi:hypothetical protein